MHQPITATMSDFTNFVDVERWPYGLEAVQFQFRGDPIAVITIGIIEQRDGVIVKIARKIVGHYEVPTIPRDPANAQIEIGQHPVDIVEVREDEVDVRQSVPESLIPVLRLLDTRVLEDFSAECLLRRLRVHSQDKDVNIFDWQTEQMIADRTTGNDCVMTRLAGNSPTRILPFLWKWWDI